MLHLKLMQRHLDFLDQVDSALMAGHLIVLYDALPPSYRQNVDEIVQLSTSTLDATTWNSFTNTIHQVGDLIVTRQRWFLSSPRIASLGEAEQEFFSGPVLSFAGLLQKPLSHRPCNLIHSSREIFASGLRAAMRQWHLTLLN